MASDDGHVSIWVGTLGSKGAFDAYLEEQRVSRSMPWRSSR